MLLIAFSPFIQWIQWDVGSFKIERDHHKSFWPYIQAIMSFHTREHASSMLGGMPRFMVEYALYWALQFGE